MIRKSINTLKQRYLRPYVFIHINKTAGSSIQSALRIPHEHKTAQEKIQEIGREAWERKFTFTFVRNPWDKVVSHYHFRVMTDQTGLKRKDIGFKRWAKLAYGDQDPEFYDNPKMFMVQSRWISDAHGNELVNYVGRYESLAKDFDTICKKISRPTIELPHVKKSSRGDYRQYYDDETAEIVQKWFLDDLRAFGYSF